MAKDPLFSNKLMGGILLAGVIASGTGFVSKLLYTTDQVAENAYPIETEDSDSGEATDAAPVDKTAWAEVSVALATARETGGDAMAQAIASGEKLFKKCSACHNIVSGGANKTGPNLWNVYGQQIAAVDGYKYSTTLEGMSSDVWNDETLNGFLTNPKEYAPGTKMSYKGIKKVEQRVGMLLYLEAQAD